MLWRLAAIGLIALACVCSLAEAQASEAAETETDRFGRDSYRPDESLGGADLVLDDEDGDDVEDSMTSDKRGGLLHFGKKRAGLLHFGKKRAGLLHFGKRYQDDMYDQSMLTELPDEEDYYDESDD